MKSNILYSLIPLIILIFFVSCSEDKNQLKYYKDTFELNNEIVKYESLSKLRRNMDRDPHKTKFYYSKALMLDSMCYDFFNNHFTKTPINFDEALDNYKIILDSVSNVFNTKNQFLPFEIKDINNKLQGPDSITSDNDLLLQL